MSREKPAAATVWHSVVKALEVFTIVIFAILIADVLWGVFSRYVLGHQSRWTEELAIYLLVWVSLLGAALTFRDRGHLGVDYFVGKLDPAARRLAAVIVDLSVLIFALTALVYGGGYLVYENLRRGQLTPAMQWEVGYLYCIVPLSGVFVAAFAIEHLLRGESQGGGGVAS